MKKLKTLGLIALTGCFTLVAHNAFAQKDLQKTCQKVKKTASNMSLAEKELLGKLDQETKAQYEKLDAEGKKLVLDLMNQSAQDFDAKAAIQLAVKNMADRHGK